MEQQTIAPAELIAKQRAAGFDNIALPGTFDDLAAVKRANAARGSTWFGKDEMRFFGTRYLTLHAGCVLSYADRNYNDTGLDYKVALLQADGGVLSVLEPKFTSRADAQRYARELAEALFTEEATS